MTKDKCACGRNGFFKVRDKNTNQELVICDFCEKPYHELIEKIEQPKPEETFGRLHLVKKTKKLFKCRICKLPILIGSACYTQSIQTIPFPTPSRLHIDCAKEQIEKGVEVVK